jgi:hypothetical protein
MKKIALFALLAAAGLSALAATRPALDRDRDRDYKLTEKEDIRKTVPLADPGQPLVLTVDNVFGGIDVQAADVKAVELSARKTLKARTAEKMTRAKAEVELKITQTGNDVDIYVDGPFRCKVGDCEGLKDRDSGYEVDYDFVLRVPRRTELTAKTVMGGDVLVRGLEGDFRVTNVDGKVTLDKMTGSGHAHTVNGPVQAAFSRCPSAACSFKTINGALNLSFPDGLTGDFSLKTMNGEAFSDFASTALPAEPAAKEKKDGRTLYRRGGFTRVRIGRGGPEFRCETLNGDIFISKTK